jgi:hypothetical protein
VATEPLWKKNLAKGNTAEARAKGVETARRNRAFGAMVLAALERHGIELSPDDPLGGEAVALAMLRNGGEDRRCVMNIAAKTIPQEIQGAVDHSLTVTIQKVALGDREIVIPNGAGHGFVGKPRDAVTGKALPAAPNRDERPTNPMPEIAVELED